MSPSFADPAYYYGDPEGFVAFDGTRVFRTDDILAASPVWENISGSIDGNIRDIQCVIETDGTVGAWLLTTTAIWWCEDIKAATVTWNEVLAVETVIASDAVFSEAANEIKAIAVSGSIPGFCIAATGPADAVIGNSYEHAYWWMSSDYGQNWTKSDMAGYIFTNLGIDRGYWLCNIHAIAIQDSTGDIYAVRAAPRVGSQGSTAVFKSVDLGVNWSQLAVIASPSHDEESAPILVPTGAGEIGFLVRGNQATADEPNLYITADDFVNVTIQTYPTGYDGVSGNWQPVRVPDLPDSLLVWHKVNSTSVYDLLYSTDNGTNWTLKFAGSGSSGITSTSRLCAPISWPPDPDMWAMVRANPSSSPIALAVQFTDDFFANVVDKSGNLETLLGTWQSARATGFFLPKPAIALSAYAVADTYDEPASALVALDPQPRSKGVEVTRRIHSPGGSVKDEELYLWLEWDYFKDKSEYQSVLTQLGLLNALTNQITIAARDQHFTWKRYNGIAVKPQIGSDGESANYFLRGVKVLVKFLQEIVDA